MGHDQFHNSPSPAQPASASEHEEDATTVVAAGHAHRTGQGNRFVAGFALAGLALASVITVWTWQSSTGDVNTRAKSSSPTALAEISTGAATPLATADKAPNPANRPPSKDPHRDPSASASRNDAQVRESILNNVAPVNEADPYLPPNAWGGTTGRPGAGEPPRGGAGSSSPDAPPAGPGREPNDGTAPDDEVFRPEWPLPMHPDSSDAPTGSSAGSSSDKPSTTPATPQSAEPTNPAAPTHSGRPQIQAGDNNGTSAAERPLADTTPANTPAQSGTGASARPSASSADTLPTGPSTARTEAPLDSKPGERPGGTASGDNPTGGSPNGPSQPTDTTGTRNS